MTARLMSLSPLTTLTTIHHCPIWHLGEGQTGQYLLWAQGLELLTKIRKNMKNRVMRLWDKLLLRKRPAEAVADRDHQRPIEEHQPD